MSLMFLNLTPFFLFIFLLANLSFSLQVKVIDLELPNVLMLYNCGTRLDVTTSGVGCTPIYTGNTLHLYNRGQPIQINVNQYLLQPNQVHMSRGMLLSLQSM